MTPTVSVAPSYPFTDLHDLSFAQFVTRRSRGAWWSPLLPRARLPARSRLEGAVAKKASGDSAIKRNKRILSSPTTNNTSSGRPYKCTVAGCTSLFGKANHLSRHVRIVHNKERPFKCDKGSCTSRFGSRSHLVDHVNAVHKRLRNFRCGRCNAAFSKSFNLAKHIRLMHNTNITKSHRCTYYPQCDLAFGTRSHLTRHISKVHKNNTNTSTTTSTTTSTKNNNNTTTTSSSTSSSSSSRDQSTLNTTTNTTNANGIINRVEAITAACA